MISIFFTRANYHNNIDSHISYIDEDGDQLFFEGAIFQITFDNGQLVKNVVDSINVFEPKRNTVILIEDSLMVHKEAIKNQDYLIISKKDFIKNIPNDEPIAIYHHYSSWSEKHQTFDNWFVDFEDVSSSNGQEGNPEPFMHEINIKSPFNSIIPLLEINNENEFHNLLINLKDTFLINKEQKEETEKLNQKLAFLHNLLGNNIDMEAIQKELDELKCSVLFNTDDRISSIKEIRDQILNEY